jgi:chaperone LolA
MSNITSNFILKRKSIFALGIVPLFFSIAASAEVPAALKKIETKYHSAKSLEAEFTQVTFSKLTQTKKESSGVISLKMPDKFRWETLKPARDKNLFVSDGKKFWSYTPPFMDGEKGQVLEKKSSEIQSQLASQLLSGAFSKMKDAKFESLSANLFRFTPKKGSAGTIEKIELTVEPKKSLIEKVKLIHENGNESEVSLSSIKLGEKFEDAYFRFAIPSGVEVIRE